jgi:PEP-CTERM motif
MKRPILLPLGILAGALLISAAAQAQVTIISEAFEGNLSPGANFSKYTFGDTDSSTSTDAMAAGVGIAGSGGWQIINNAPSGANGFSGIGAQYQNGGIHGNTSANLSDYVLSFDAKANAGSVNIQIQTWNGSGFSGGMSGTLSTAPNPPGFGNDQVLTPGFTHYALNLGNTTVFPNGSINMQGGTIQIAMQFDGGGATPYQNTLIIDNLALTMVPEPSCLALLGLGAIGWVVKRGQALIS